MLEALELKISIFGLSPGLQVELGYVIGVRLANCYSSSLRVFV